MANGASSGRKRPMNHLLVQLQIVTAEAQLFFWGEQRVGLDLMTGVAHSGGIRAVFEVSTRTGGSGRSDSSLRESSFLFLGVGNTVKEQTQSLVTAPVQERSNKTDNP